MKVLLVYPPLAFPDNVYASIPILLGQLQNRGIEATALDMNVEFLKYILSVENLKKTKLKILEIYEKGIDDVEYEKHIKNILVTNRAIIDEILTLSQEPYIEFIKEPFTKEKEEKLFYALSLAFMPFFPSKLLVSWGVNPALVERNPNYKNTYESIIDKCLDRDKNIYFEFYEKIIEKIKKEKYDVIGITVPFETNLYPALTLSKMLKEKMNAKVVLGGILINSTIDSYLEHPDMLENFADAFLIGEGECALPDYIRYLEGKISVEEVNGLVCLKDGKIIKNKIARIESHNEIKKPAFNGLNFDDYCYRQISLEFSKGCYWGRCVYCYANLQKRYYISDPKYAVDIIEEIVLKHNIKYFYILDDSLNIKFADKLADEIIARNLEIKYDAFFRFEKAINKKFLKKQKNAGLSAVFWGLESASPRVLKLMNKGIDISNVERILKITHEQGINSDLGVMFGFPTETKDDVLKTINFLKKNDRYIRFCNYFYFTLLKSSGLMYNKDKVKITKTLDKEPFSDYLLHNAPCIPRKELYELLLKYGIKAPQIYSKW